MKYILIALFLSGLTANSVIAQLPPELSETSATDNAYQNAAGSYKDVIGRNSRIYTGKYYFDRNLGIAGHPFYIDNFWDTESIVYDGQRYDSIEIRYDIYNDFLLIKYIDPEGYVTPVELNNEKVDAFTFKKHHFFRIEKGTSDQLNSGFYDLLHAGKPVTVLAKRRKEISRLNSSGGQVREYQTKDRYYIKYGEQYHPASGKKAMLQILSDRKNEIKTFLKNNKAALRKNFERQLVEVARFYNDSLNPEQR